MRKDVSARDFLSLGGIVTLTRANSQVCPLGRANQDSPEPAISPVIIRVVSEQILSLQFLGDLAEYGGEVLKPFGNESLAPC